MTCIRNTGDNSWGGAIRSMLFAFLALSPVFLSAQGEFNKWYFGAWAAIDFNTIPPTGLPASTMNTFHASVSVSDSIGNLLFYSQGLSVYNRNHLVMPNGNGLFGDQLVQGVFTVRKPGEDNLFYLFTIYNNIFPVSYGLFYSVIDMSLNGGLGDVVVGFKNIPVSGAEDARCGIHGTSHFNNRDAWIVVRKISSNQYASYRITASGISTIPVLTSCSLPSCDFYTCEHELIKISQDGTRYVFVSHDPVQNIHIAELGIFNSQTGQLTPLFHFRPVNVVPENPLYFEFSPDSKLLYTVSSFTTDNRLIFQYNMAFSDSAQFMQSQILIASPHVGHALQLGPDGKIYQCVGDIDSLNVINNPNVQGSGCNFQTNAISLSSGTFNHSGLPQFLQRYKAYLNYTGSDCQFDSVHFSGDIWPPADTIRWNFGDPGSGAYNTSFLASPSHLFSSPGTYTVELYVRHNDNRTDTMWRTITIYPTPALALGPDKTICTGNTTTFDAGICIGCSFEWKNLGSGIVVGTNQTYTTGIAGAYRVMVSNANGCTGYDTVQLMTTTTPVVTNNPPLIKTICTGELTNIMLTGNVPEVLFNWTVTLTSGNISGFQADSGLLINQTLINIGATVGVVTYHITPKIGDCAGTPVDFAVIVNVGNPVDVSITPSINNSCAGTIVAYTATPTNPGTNPTYQWKVNTLNAGFNSPIFTYLPINGDIVQCVLTSSNTLCTSNNPAISNSINMVVNPIQPVSVTVSPSSNPVCAGAQVSFTAIPVNGGITPQYQWKVNGINAGTNNPIFAFSPVNGDVVICSMLSSEACTSENPSQSNPVTMMVNANLPAGINIVASANPFCPGSAVTFTATPVNGGSNPSYQWKVNGINTGTNSSGFSYVPANNDSVRCVINSNLSCVTGNPASSANIIMIGSLAPNVTFPACFDTVTTVNAKPFRLKGGLPIGGNYSGPGVNSSTAIFTPSVAGIGVKTINYSYINVHDCGASKSKSIVVQPYSSISCGNNYVDTRDNKVYPTVQIGTQCWMTVNLNYGSTIPSSQVQYDNCIPEKYCYNDLAGNCTKYGGLYQWDEVMKYEDTPAGQGLCPPGWHVPTESEWTTLFNYYLGNSLAGKPLQDTIISGFKARTSGVFYLNSSWSFNGFATLFWSSTPWSAKKGISHGMNVYDHSVSMYPSSKANAFPIRCLYD